MGRHRGCPGNTSGKLEDAALPRTFWLVEIGHVQYAAMPDSPYDFFDDPKLIFRRAIMETKDTNGLVE